MSNDVTIAKLLDVACIALLEQGGVDNWEWYGDSLEHYVPSSDKYEDAQSLLNSLELGGVDNWTWYSESLEGYDEYEEYLHTLTDLNTALYIWEWKQKVEQEATVEPVAEVEVIPVAEKRVVSGEAEKALYDFIVAKFDAEKADDVFELTIERGIWKYNTFTVEYKAAVKKIVKGVDFPLEVARAALLAAIIKNGKLNKFLDEITS